jgi:hypothetical protein
VRFWRRCWNESCGTSALYTTHCKIICLVTGWTPSPTRTSSKLRARGDLRALRRRTNQTLLGGGGVIINHQMKGRLILKGHTAPIGAGVSRKRVREEAKDVSGVAASGIQVGGMAASTDRNVLAAASSAASITRTPGSGTLRTSSTTVYGIGTSFDTEVRGGDVLEVGAEARPVAFVLSATSISLKEAFNNDIAAPASFIIARLASVDKAVDPAAAARAAAKVRAADIERQTDTGGSRFQVKGVAKGTYVMGAPISTAASLSREDLLDLRSKARGRDKFA